MKTRILKSLMTTLYLILFVSVVKGFQTSENLNDPSIKEYVALSSVQLDSIIPLICDAPVNPSWLEQVSITRKTFEEPTVRIAYVIPSNRSPQPKGAEALQKIIRTSRDFFKEEMTYNGFDSKTFRYETEQDGKTPLIHMVNIPETDEQIRGKNNEQLEAWQNTINALMNVGLSIWQDGQIWLIVAETHLQEPNGNIIGDIALGSGSGCTANDPGVAILSSTLLTPIANETLTDDRSYNGLIIPEIGPYPLKQNLSFPWFEGSTVSSITSSTFGAFLHEMSHALGIYHHDFRNDTNFHGNLMGHGLRGLRGHLYPNQYPENYTRLAYSTALALDTNHYFNTGKQRNQIDDILISLISATPKEGKLTFDIKASDTDGLSMIQLFSLSGYSVERVLQGTHFEGQIKTPYFEPGTETTFRVKLYDKQGNKTERSITLKPHTGDRAPWPFIRISPAIGTFGDSFVLDSGLSEDPDGNSQLMFEWDFDNDGIFDTKSNKNPLITKEISAGNHLIRLKVKKPSGAFHVSTPISLHVDGDMPPAEVSFTLIDADTNKPILGFDPIPEGAELDFSSLPSKLNIRANVPNHYESVRFDFNEQENFRIENVEPYALFGDIQGEYNSGSDELLSPPLIGNESSHTLTATPYSQDGARGASGTKGVLKFSTKAKPILFTMVDANTNTDLYTIKEGMSISSFSILNKNLNIKTSHEIPREDLKVHFKLTGPINRDWTEESFPFALFGDVDGNYNGVQLTAGTYHLKADFEFKFAQCCESSQLSTEVTFNIVESAISYFALHAVPSLGEPLEFSDNGRIFKFIDLPFSRGSVAITAKPTTAVGSIKLEISGPLTYSKIENVAPYSLFGDIDGDFDSRFFPEGEYIISATPYSKADGQGEEGASLAVSFRVEMHFGTGFIKIFDVETGNEIEDLFLSNDGNTIDINETPTDNATIIVAYEQCDFICPGSVLLELDGPISTSRIENIRPYTLFGDIDSNLNGRKFPIGNYTIAITPFSGPNGTGTVSQTQIRDFQIIDSGAFPITQAIIYPNPARDNIIFRMDTKSVATGNAIIFDFLGREVKRVSNLDRATEQKINISELSPGIYIVKIYTGKTIETKKLVVQ